MIEKKKDEPKELSYFVFVQHKDLSSVSYQKVTSRLKGFNVFKSVLNMI